MIPKHHHHPNRAPPACLVARAPPIARASEPAWPASEPACRKAPGWMVMDRQNTRDVQALKIISRQKYLENIYIRKFKYSTFFFEGNESGCFFFRALGVSIWWKLTSRAVIQGSGFIGQLTSYCWSFRNQAVAPIEDWRIVCGWIPKN